MTGNTTIIEPLTEDSKVDIQLPFFVLIEQRQVDDPRLMMRLFKEQYIVTDIWKKRYQSYIRIHKGKKMTKRERVSGLLKGVKWLLIFNWAIILLAVLANYAGLLSTLIISLPLLIIQIVFWFVGAVDLWGRWCVYSAAGLEYKLGNETNNDNRGKPTNG